MTHYANGIDQAVLAMATHDETPDPVPDAPTIEQDEIAAAIVARGETVTYANYAAEHEKAGVSERQQPTALSEADGAWVDERAREVLASRGVERPTLAQYREALSDAHALLIRGRS